MFEFLGFSAPTLALTGQQLNHLTKRGSEGAKHGSGECVFTGRATIKLSTAAIVPRHRERLRLRVPAANPRKIGVNKESSENGEGE